MFGSEVVVSSYYKSRWSHNAEYHMLCVQKMCIEDDTVTYSKWKVFIVCFYFNSIATLLC